MFKTCEKCFGERKYRCEIRKEWFKCEGCDGRGLVIDKDKEREAAQLEAIKAEAQRIVEQKEIDKEEVEKAIAIASAKRGKQAVAS